MGKSRNTKLNARTNNDVPEEYIDSTGWYDNEDMTLLFNSLENTNISFDHVDFHDGTIYLKDGQTTIILEMGVFNHFIFGEGEYKLEDVWDVWQNVPLLFKENISSFKLDQYGSTIGGWHWGDEEHGHPDKSIIALNRGNFSGRYETKETSWDIKQLLLHECAHALDYHKGRYGIDGVELSDHSEKFRRISQTEIASSYVKEKVLAGDHPENFLRENLADAMMIVASHRIYGSGKIGSDSLSFVGDGSNDINYSEWQQTHPQLDKLCNDILNCNSWTEVEALF